MQEVYAYIKNWAWKTCRCSLQIKTQEQVNILSKVLQYYVIFSAEDYLTYAHELTDEIFAEYEASDPFVNSFIEQLDKLIANFNHLLVPENYKVTKISQFDRLIITF